MIPWTCIADGSPLTASAAGLACAKCDRRYPHAAGLAVFAAGPARHSALLDEIVGRAAGGPLDRAAGEVCERRGLLRNRFTTDWDFFLPLARAGRVAHVGPGFGDRTLALARAARTVVALVPGEAHGRALQRHAGEQGAGNVQVAVIDDARRLPLADGSVDVVAMDAPAAAAFGVDGGAIETVVAEFRRVLAPGGALLLGAGNRLFRVPALERLRPGSGRPTLDDALAAERVPRVRALALGPALAALKQSGFQAPTLLAPLPRREEIAIVIPVRERAVLQYFFARLFRRNSPLMRAGLALAQLAARLDMIWWVVPDYFVIAKLNPDEKHHP